MAEQEQSTSGTGPAAPEGAEATGPTTKRSGNYTVTVKSPGGAEGYLTMWALEDSPALAINGPAYRGPLADGEVEVLKSTPGVHFAADLEIAVREG